MSIDFEEMKARVERAMLQMTGELDSRRVRELLQRRTAAMLGRGSQEEAPHILHEVVVVRREATRLGIPMRYVSEIRKVAPFALPHATPTVTGLFHIRGTASTLIDVQPFFGKVTPPKKAESCLTVILQGDPGKLGLYIDEVLGPRLVSSEECDAGLQDPRFSFVEAVTRDLLAVINVDKLFEHPEFQIEASLS